MKTVPVPIYAGLCIATLLTLASVPLRRLLAHQGLKAHPADPAFPAPKAQQELQVLPAHKARRGLPVIPALKALQGPPATPALKAPQGPPALQAHKARRVYTALHFGLDMYM